MATIAGVKPHPIYLAGSWVDSPDVLEIANPARPGELAGTTYLATEAQYEQAVEAAVRAFEVTRTLPAYERGRILREVSAGIKARREELGALIAAEAGKPIRDALAEVDRAALTFRLGAEEAERAYGEVIPLDLMPSSKDRVGITRRFPIGPIAAISPFNFPLNLAAHKVAPAIAAGNPIVLKPPSKDPLVMLAVAEIIDAAGVPPGMVSHPADEPRAGRPDGGRRAVQAPDVHGLAVGRLADEGAGRQEEGRPGARRERGRHRGQVRGHRLGGEAHARRRVAYSGQVCISVQRMFIHEDVWDAFMDKFLAGVAALKLGDPADPTTDVGPMVDAKAAARTQAWVDEAKALGGEILAGGTADGTFFPPTVITGVPFSAQVCSNEAFAPLVVAFPFTDMDEAIAAVNDSFFGLQTGVFTSDLGAAWKSFSELEVGGVIVNDIPTYRIDNMPYGGVKDSGLGREGIRWAIEDMTEIRIMVLAWPQ